MKYSDENSMKELRESLEAVVLGWPGVATKKMFGCPCYLVDKSMFALLMTGGVVLTRLDEKGKKELVAAFPTEPFQAGQRTVGNWLKVRMDDQSDVKRILKFVRKSYAAAAGPKT